MCASEPHETMVYICILKHYKHTCWLVGLLLVSRSRLVEEDADVV